MALPTLAIDAKSFGFGFIVFVRWLSPDERELKSPVATGPRITAAHSSSEAMRERADQIIASSKLSH